MGVQNLNRVDLFGQDRAETGQALGQEGLVGKRDILGRQGGAVGKLGLGAQVENDPTAILGVLHRLTQQTIGRRRIIGGTGQDGFKEHRRQTRRTPLGRIGVHGIEPAERGQRYLTTLGRVGIDVIKMREIRRIGQFVKGRNAVGCDDRFLCFGLSGRPHQGRSGQTNGQCHALGRAVVGLLCDCDCTRLAGVSHPDPPGVCLPI